MAISAGAGGGFPWALLQMGLEVGELPPPCQGVLLVLISPDGGTPLLSLQTMDRSFSQPQTTESSRTPTLLLEASMATKRCP